MEFKVQVIPKIEPIQFNYDELKQELTERVSEYKTIAYTADTIKTAKADRAKLNALKKSLNDERIRLEKEYMAPFMDFKTKVSELVGIVDEAASTIDRQVKEYEEMKRQEKNNLIIKLGEEVLAGYEWLALSQIWNDKWLNATYNEKHIKEDMEESLRKIDEDIQVLARLPEYSFEAIDTYKRTLRVDDALWEADHLKQMAEAKREAETAKLRAETAKSEDVQTQAEVTISEQKNTNMGEFERQRTAISFRVFVTMEQAVRLSQFMKTEGIEFERI